MSSARNTVRAPRERTRDGLRLFIFTLLAVEFLDELVFGVRETAWPLIRDDLRLTYTQVGVVLSVPVVFGSVVEPAIGILGDVWRRRALVIAGGLAYAAGVLLFGLSTSFALLLAAACLVNPSAGAFVGL